MSLTVKILTLLTGAWTVESAKYACESRMSASGSGQIQSPDFPAVKNAYTCQNYFRYPQPKGAVLLNITDISLYYLKGRTKVCSGSLEIGTYTASCLNAAPACIVYFNDKICIQSIVSKHGNKCRYFQDTGRTVDMLLTSDGQIGKGGTDNGTDTSSWSYPKGVRLTYEFADCPQDPTATTTVPRTHRTTISPGLIRFTTSSTTRSLLSTMTGSSRSTTPRRINNGSVTLGTQAVQNETNSSQQPYKRAGLILSFTEIIIISVVLFIVLVVIVIVIVLIVLKAKTKKKSWDMRLPSVLGREYAANGDVPPSARTTAT